MSALIDPELKSKINEASKTADDFTKNYYDGVDKKKNIAGLYMESSLLVWNGNGYSGIENIKKFFKELPSTEHELKTVDAQPIIDGAVSEQHTFLIQVSGTVKLGENRLKAFQQTFVITAQNSKWKIVTDCFRLQDGICAGIKSEF
ncbi:unnamed protein product [Diamesa hyperborea]